MKASELKAMLHAVDPDWMRNKGTQEAARVCGLSLHSEHIAEQADLATAFGTFLADYPNACGWLCRQSDVVWFRDGQLPLDAKVQYGELVGDAHTSLLIRPDGKGGLRLIYQQETSGDTHLAIPHCHIGRRRPPKGEPVAKLHYRTYWTPHTDVTKGGYRAETTRLILIQKGEK